jgi:[ribosomal protein S5]-alanine N-acetyltransferase
LIETKRLILRSPIDADMDAIYRVWIEPGVRKFLWDDEIISRETAQEVIASSVQSFRENGFGIWVIVFRENQELIGFCGFRNSDADEIELLYGVTAAYWG